MPEIFHDYGNGIVAYVMEGEYPGSLIFKYGDYNLFFEAYKCCQLYAQSMLEMGWAKNYKLRADVYEQQLELYLE